MDRAIEIIFIAALIIGLLSGAGRNQSANYNANSSWASHNSVYYEDANTGQNFYNADYQKYAGYENPYIGAQFYYDDLQTYGPEYLR